MVCLCIFALGFFLYKASHFVEKEIEKASIHETIDHEIDDVEGYAIILNALGVGIEFIAEIILYVVAIVCAVFGIIMLILSLIAYFLCKTVTSYRIITSIILFIQSSIPLSLAAQLRSHFNIYILILVLLSSALFILEIHNTFSDNIKEGY